MFHSKEENTSRSSEVKLKNKNIIWSIFSLPSLIKLEGEQETRGKSSYGDIVAMRRYRYTA